MAESQSRSALRLAEPRVLREKTLSRLFIDLDLERVLRLDVLSPLRRRPGADLVKQALDVGQAREGLFAKHVRNHACPAPHGHVDDRVGIGDHVPTGREVFFDDVPVAPGLEIIAIDGVGIRLWRMVLEVNCLPAIGANAGRDEHQP